MSSAPGGRIVALVPAAGRGIRLGAAIPKAFVSLGGASLMRRAAEGLLESGVVDHVVVIVPEDDIEDAAAQLPETVEVVAGGAERVDSVRAGILATPDADVYLVHDAARALTPPELIARVVAEVQCGRPAVVPALEVVDTIKTVDILGGVTGTLKRSELRAIQTPQGFDAELLRRAYGLQSGGAAESAAQGVALTEVTDDAGLVERLGERVRTIPGDPLAFKITTQLDLALARALVGHQED